MTSKNFIIWLKGFTEGVHQYNITPVQWETLKEQLAKVDDNTIPMGGVITDHNTFKITTHPGYGCITYTTGSAGWNYTATNDKTLLND